VKVQLVMVASTVCLAFLPTNNSRFFCQRVNLDAKLRTNQLCAFTTFSFSKRFIISLASTK